MVERTKKPKSPACPDEEELAALAEGVQAPQRTVDLEKHVRLCEQCRNYLAEARANDAFVPEVRRAASHDTTGGVNSHADDLSPFDPHMVPGYAVTREIHRGGQGVVYEATQHSTGQRVAIKIMRDGPFAGLEDRARFEREVRILGHLNHPNIVGIHDRGEVAGCYFLVMDFIEGDPLDAFVSLNNLTTKRKMELFARVCDAVHSAHLRTVIHRDLKPSNILIDRQGEPHVLDFGLAKHEGEDVTQVTVTRSGHLMGSLPWASPEQVEGSSETIDLRSDVYSLGAVFYQMLTGEFPFDVSGSTYVISRRILQDEPIRPSVRVADLKGDVDAIIAACLAKRPDERYESAGELAADVRRHLAGEPVSVRAHSATYRLWKLLLRHRLAMWTTIAGLVFAIGLAATVLSGYANAKRREQLEAAQYVNLVALANAGIQKNNVGLARQMLSEAPVKHRAWEWDFLRSQTDQSQAILAGQNEELMSLAINRSGQLVAAGNRAGSISVWTLPSGSLKYVIAAHESVVNDLAFTADEKFLLSAGFDGTLRQWRLDSGRCERNLLKTNVRIMTVATDTIGRRIAAGAEDNHLYVFDAETYALLWELPAHSLGVSSVEFSPDGAHIASGGYDGAVRIWNAGSGKQVHSYNGFQGVINGLSFDRTGSQLLISDNRGTATLAEWLTDSITCLHRGEAGPAPVTVLFPDGKHYLAGDPNGLIQVLETAGPALVAELRGHEYGLNSLAFGPDGSWFASAAFDGTVRIWPSRPDANPMKLVGHYSTTQALCFGNGGQTLVTGGADLLLRRWNLETGALLQTTPGHRDSISGCFTTPDGETLLTAANHDGIRVWNSTSAEFISWLDITRGRAALNSASVCPDSTRVAANFHDRSFGVWDLQTGEPYWIRSAEAEHLGTLAVSPDAQYLASGDYEGRVNIWSLDDGHLIHRTRPLDEQILAVTFANDSTHFAVGGSTIVGLFDAQTFREVWVTPGHTSPVASIAFSPDDRRLVSGSQDGTIKLWRVVDGVPVLLLHDELGIVMRVAFSPDGERIAAACMDGGVSVWDSKSRAPALGAARTAVATTAEKVEVLFTQLHFSSSVMEFLRADASLDPIARRAALELVAIRGDNPWQLSEEAWYIVRQPGRSAEDYQMALEKAELANRLLSDHPSLLNNLGVARYRCGQYAKALEALVRADQLRAGTQIQDIAFQAMALCRLGRVEDARTQLDRAQKLANSMESGGDGWRQGHLREAEEVIEGSNCGATSR